MQLKPTRRDKKIILAATVIILSTMCLWYSFCGISDVTDNSSLNGGYTRAAIFILQAPVVVSKNVALPPSQREASDIDVPAGCRLQITRVTYRHGMFAVPADNFPRTFAEARFLDGPLAGTSVDISWISQRRSDQHRFITIDPTYLRLADPP